MATSPFFTLYIFSFRYNLEDTLCQHCIGDAFEPGDVCTGYEVVAQAVAGSCVFAVLVNRVHDFMETVVDFFGSPYQAFAVLAHFQGRCSDTAGVDGFRRSDDDVFLVE